MKKRKVFITSNLFDAAITSFDTKIFELKIHEDTDYPLLEKDLITIGNEYDIIVSNLTNKFTPNVLNNSKRLQLISNIAVGYDNIDIECATRNKILVATTPGVLHHSVAEFSIGLLLMALKKVSFHQALQQSSEYPRWCPTFGLGLELRNMNVGIVGFGQIGQEIGRILKNGFNCNIHYLKHNKIHNPGYPTIPLEKLEFFKTQRIIILSCPLNDSTKNFFGKNEIELIQKGTILINISRGEIIDQTSLLKNLEKFDAIALDVTTPDPLPKNHPLLKNEKVFITPHIASATYQARQKMIELAIQNVLTYVNKGEKFLKNAINTL